MHSAQLLLLFDGEFGLLASQFSFSAGNGHSFTSAQANQVGLELGEGGQDVEKHFAHWIGGVVHVRAKRQLYAACNQCIGDVTSIRNGPG